MARIIRGNWNCELSGLLLDKRLGTLTVIRRRDYFTGLLMSICTCTYGDALNYVKDLLIQDSHVQQDLTGASNDFSVSLANIELYKESFTQQTLNYLSELSNFKYSFIKCF